MNKNKVIGYMPFLAAILSLCGSVFKSTILSFSAIILIIGWSIMQYKEQPRPGYIILAVGCIVALIFVGCMVRTGRYNV